jgi:RNA helicase armi
LSIQTVFDHFLPQITPYALQVKHIRRIFDSALPEGAPKVGTVEEFQGQERQIILISTVRTNEAYINSDIFFGLGFLKCEKRMNVAISRARALLVVFGKESVLGQDSNWNHLIQYTKNNGTYVSVMK